MPNRTLRALLGGRADSLIDQLAERLDAARNAEDTRAAVAALLTADPNHGYPVELQHRGQPRGGAAGAEVVPDTVSQALMKMDTPAYVQGRLMDVLAANERARAVTSFFTPGTNLVLSTFLGTAARERAADWEPSTRAMVRHLLDRAERDPSDRELHNLVGELAVRSERFRQLWAEEGPAPQVTGVGEWRHPIVGQLRLTREKTPIDGTDGMMLVVYRAEKGSISEMALDLLKTLPPESSPV